jgi:superfamily I DNA/RNA helicase
MQDLTPEQQQALTLEGQQCCLIAGPGSGKTHTLVARILQDSKTTAPERMVVVTFTNAAANELRHRLEAFGANPRRFRHLGTLHSWAASQMWQAGDHREIATDSQIKKVIEGVKKTLGAMARNLSGPEAWRAAVDPPRFGILKQVGHAIRNSMMQARLTHHDLVLADFLTIVEKGFCTPPLQIYVDEYQDSALVDARIYQAMQALGSRLFLIGDPRQAIYGFRGATPDNLDQAWQAADSRAQLTRCFRSGPEICQLATRIAEKMISGDFDPQVLPIRDDPASVAFCHHDSDLEELAATVEQVTAWEACGLSCAVLTRYNHQARLVTAALRAKGHQVQCSAEIQQPDQGQQSLEDSIQRMQNYRAVATTDHGWLQTMTVLGIPMKNQDALLPSLRSIRMPEDLISLGDPSDQTGQQAGMIVVTTIHGAKGLEWDAVAFIGADSAAFSDQSQEAARLCFVACSRARKALVVSHATSRLQPESGKTLTGLTFTNWIPTNV